MTQSKQNNQKRIKKVTIISNEQLYKLAPFTKKCDNSHRETILEFIYETGIEIPIDNIYNISSQELAYELIAKGFSVLLYNSKESPANLTIYLPETLSIEQKQYLQIALSMLNQCTLTVFTINIKQSVLDFQSEASKSIEDLTTYITTIPEYSTKSSSKISTNQLVKIPKDN